MKRCAFIPLSCVALNAYAWEFMEDQDDMTGKPIRSAFVMSENQLDLKWPYGTAVGFLGVHNHPRYGRSAVINVSKGQMLCYINECPVLARFDDGAPMRFSGNPPADHSRTTIFIEGHDRFVKALKNSKTVRIEVGFYQQGSKTLVFNTSDFPIDRMTPPTTKKK